MTASTAGPSLYDLRSLKSARAKKIWKKFASLLYSINCTQYTLCTHLMSRAKAMGWTPVKMQLWNEI